MSFLIKTTQIMVLEEVTTPGYPPMLLPWEKRLEDAGPTARMGGGVIPAHSTELPVALPGIVTVSTLWFYPAAALTVFLGVGTTVGLPMLAGGCLGFTVGAAEYGDDFLRVTYTGDEDMAYTIVWGGS